MAFTMDSPMAFPIQWVLPYDWALYSTMGFAMEPPVGFAIQWVLQQTKFHFEAIFHDFPLPVY